MRSARLEDCEGLPLQFAPRVDAAASESNWIPMGNHRSPRNPRRRLEEMSTADRLRLDAKATEREPDSLLEEVQAESDEPITDRWT